VCETSWLLLPTKATILLSLSHLSVVSLVAVGLRPPLIMLEYAPYGTLATLYKDSNEHHRREAPALKHRIAIQVYMARQILELYLFQLYRVP